MESDAKRKIFISHSSKDKEYGQAIFNFLSEIGLKNRIFFSSDVDKSVPVNQDIFQYLEEQIHEDAYMLFLLSEHFYDSIACMNEMGAAWGKKNIYALIVVPGFDIKNNKVQESAVNPRQMSICLDDAPRMKQLTTDILNHFSMQADEEIINTQCEKYLQEIDRIKKIPDIKMQNDLANIERELKKTPLNPQLYLKRGQTLYSLDKQNYHKAIRDYLYAIFLDMNFFDAYSRLIQDATMEKDYEQAMWFAQEACRRFPQNGNSYGCRAYVEHAKKLYNEAIADCNLAISLTENRWFYNTRGRCYMKQNKLKEALIDFWTAHNMDPKYKPAVKNIKNAVEKIGYSKIMAYALEQKQNGDFDKSLMYLECLEISNPSTEELWQEYGSLYYDFEKYAQALEYWKKALNLHNSCRNNYLCAAALYHLKKYPPAREYCQISLDFPDDGYYKYAEALLLNIEEKMHV